MTYSADTPIAWFYSGDEGVARVIAPRAAQALMNMVQGHIDQDTWIRQVLTFPEGTVTIRSGFGHIRVYVHGHEYPTTTSKEERTEHRDPKAEGIVNWQARGFVVCPAAANNTAYGLPLTNKTPTLGGYMGWVLISKHAANYPDDVFRRVLKLDKTLPTESKYRSLLRMHRAYNARDLEEFDRAPDGSVVPNQVGVPRTKNTYRPGITRGSKFYPQYKSFTELEPEFKPVMSTRYTAYWPEILTGKPFQQGALFKSNAYRADVGQLEVFGPLKGWTDDLAGLAVKGVSAARTAGHNVVPNPTLDPPFKGARESFQWAYDRISASGMYAGENMLVAPDTSDTRDGGIKAVDHWRDSPPHYSNIIFSGWSGGQGDAETPRVWYDYPYLEYTAALQHDTANFRDRGVMSAAVAEGGARIYRESGPPYDGEVLEATTPGSTLYSSQVFSLPAPSPARVPSGALRPISYPYEVNRIWAAQVGAGPVQLYASVAMRSPFVSIHGKLYRVAYDSMGLSTTGSSIVLAAGYRTDEKGETFIRSVILTFDDIEFIANPNPITSTGTIYAWKGENNGPGTMHMKLRTDRIRKVLVTDTPLVLGYTETGTIPQRYTKRITLVTSLDLPARTQTVYGAAVSKDGTKFALLYSVIAKPSELPNVPDAMPEDLYWNENIALPGDAASYRRPYTLYGEAIRVLEGSGSSGFAVVRTATGLVNFSADVSSGGGTYTADYNSSCSTSVPIGITYSPLGVLQYAEQTITADQYGGLNSAAGHSNIETTIQFPNGEVMTVVSENLVQTVTSSQAWLPPYPPVMSGTSKQCMLLFVDWYKPADTVFMEAIAGVDGYRTAIKMGPTGAKTLYAPPAVPLVWPSSGRAAFCTYSDNGFLGSALLPASFGYRGFGINCAATSDGYAGYRAPRTTSSPSGYTFSGTAAVMASNISNFGPGPVAGGSIGFGIRQFNCLGATIPFFGAPHAQLGVTFYSSLGGVAVYVYSSDNIRGDYGAPPPDMSVLRNSFAVAALDGDAIVEGVWLHIGTPSKLVDGTWWTDAQRTTIDAGNRAFVDSQAPGYFRCSTFDIESVLGVDAKYTLPFGVIE